MYRSIRLVLSACAALTASTPAWAAVVFTEDFDADHSASWSYFSSIAADPRNDGIKGEADFFFDYSTIGIPSAPNSTGGTTRGMRLRANLPTAGAGTADDLFSGVSVSPTGFSVTGSYELRCDAWLNYNGPLNGGGTGSTQVTGWGIMSNGTVVQWAGGTQTSLWFGMTGDGGSSVDYRAYSSAAGVGYLPASGVFAAGTSTSPDSRNNIHPYYAALGALSAPAAQLGFFPGQTGATLTGAAGFKWWRVIVKKAGSIVTWTLKDPGSSFELLIATVDSSTITTSGTNILFNHFDINATQVPDPPAVDGQLLFGLIDNIEVDQLQPPPAIADEPDDLLITVGDNASFTVAATPGIGGTLHYAWVKNGTIPVGGDSPTLSLTNVPYSDNGSTYRVTVSEDGNPTSINSRTAVLTVVPPPCNDPFADADGNGTVDLNDYGKWQQCHTGPTGTGFNFVNCRCFDRDGDSDVDENDLLPFTACIGAHPLPANPACDNSFYPTGAVVINEIVYDQVTAAGAAVNDSEEFVELLNTGATPVDISGWTLRASDQVGPSPSLGNPTGDDNPDYKIPGLPGSGTTILAPGAFYVVGSAAVTPPANLVVTSPNAQGLWEDFREALELLDGNGIAVDTLVYNKSQGPDGSIAIGTPKGRVWGDFVTVNVNFQSLSRWVDGLNTNDNGRDFGMRPRTPGSSNHASAPVFSAYLPPNVNSAAVGDPVAGLNGSFKEARVINPTVQTSGTAPAGLNPNAIPRSPQDPDDAGARCIIAWDEAGGGNTVWSNGIATTDGSFDLWVYLDTSDITVAGAESTSYGIMGTTDPFYQFPDPTGNLLPSTSILTNGNTGIAWVFQKDNANNHKRLVLVDARDGGDSSLFGGIYWTVVQTIDMSAVASGWYRLSIAYTGATGAVVARFRDTASVDQVTPINHTTTAGLKGGFYVGYRESLTGQPLTLRPPTFDGL